MKTKYLFLSLLFFAILASCSNDEPAAAASGEEKTVNLSLRYSDASTRNIGGQQTAGAPTLTNVYVEFYSAASGGGTKLSTTQLTPTELASLINGTVKLTTPAAAKSMRMVANNGTSVVLPTAIADYQSKDVKTAIPYEGIGDISDQTTDGVTTSTATIALKVAVARIEVYGSIGCTNADNGCTVDVEAVYCNQYLESVGGTVHVLASTTPPTVDNAVTGMFDTQAANSAEWGNAFTANPTKCAGYQLFAGSYGVTLQVKVTQEGGSTSQGFIVVKGFKKADDQAAIAALEAGKIYTLNLAASGIKDLFVKDSPETPVTPDPSGKDKETTVTATVTTWTVQAVTPQL